MSDEFATIRVDGKVAVLDFSDVPPEDIPVILESIEYDLYDYTSATGLKAEVIATTPMDNSSIAADFGAFGASAADISSAYLPFENIDDWLRSVPFLPRRGYVEEQYGRVAARDAAAAAAAIAAENKRFNDAISAFDREVLLQNRKFEDEARRLSDIAAQTKSQYDIQAAQRAVATAERNKAEQAANFELQMDSFDNTQGDFFRDTSTGADPSRAMRSAYVGNQSPLAQYAQRVQDLATASNQEKLDIQQERISEADRQAQAAIRDRQDAANAAEMEAAQKETNRQLAASVVSRSLGYNRLSSDQKESLVQTRLDGGDWESEMTSFNTVSSDVGPPQGSVDVAAENAANSGNTFGWGTPPV